MRVRHEILLAATVITREHDNLHTIRKRPDKLPAPLARSAQSRCRTSESSTLVVLGPTDVTYFMRSTRISWTIFRLGQLFDLVQRKKT